MQVAAAAHGGADLRVGLSQYGQTFPLCYGYVRLPGQMIYSNRLQPHPASGKGAAKGKGGSQTEYSATMAFAFAAAPTGANGSSVSLYQVWADKQIIWSANNEHNDNTYCDTAANVAEDNGLSLAEYDDMPASQQQFFVQACQSRHNNQGFLLVHPEKIHFYDGWEEQPVDSALESVVGGGITPAYRGTVYMALDDIGLTREGGSRPSIEIEATFPITTLGGIIEDLCLRAGIPAAALNTASFAAASDNVTGYVADQSSLAEAISPLLSAYLYDLPEIDGQLTLVKRGQAPVAVLPITDLGAKAAPMGGSDKPEPRISEPRADELDLPSYMELTYFSSTRDCQKGMQIARRLTANHYHKTTVDFAITMSDDQARTMVEQQIDTVWAERASGESAVTYAYAWLAASNVVISPAGVRYRIVQIDAGVPDVLKLSLVRDSEAMTVQTGVGSSMPTSSTAAPIVPTLFQAWSGTELSDADAMTPGFYVTGTGQSGWSGASIYYSPDGGTSWIQSGVIAAPSVIGASVSTLGAAADSTDWDTANSAVIQCIQPGALASNTEAAVLAGANLCRLGAEYIAFSVATLGSAAGRYTLSTLRRGIRSTPFVAHASGDPFTTLTGVVRVIVPTALIGQTVLVACVSPGQAISDVTASAQSVVIAAPNVPYVTPTIPTAPSGILLLQNAAASPNQIVGGVFNSAAPSASGGWIAYIEKSVNAGSTWSTLGYFIGGAFADTLAAGTARYRATILGQNGTQAAPATAMYLPGSSSAVADLSFITPASTAGAPGVRGSLIYTGSGAPGSIAGQLNNDLYLNSATSDVYQLVSGAWALQENIKGGAGAAGTPGSSGAPGAAVTISGITASALSAGSAPTASVSAGSNNSYSISLGIPAGTPGSNATALKRRCTLVFFEPTQTGIDLTQIVTLPPGSAQASVTWIPQVIRFRTNTPSASATTVQPVSGATGNNAFGTGTALTSSALSNSGTGSYLSTSSGFTAAAAAGLASGTPIGVNWSAINGTNGTVEIDFEASAAG